MEILFILHAFEAWAFADGSQLQERARVRDVAALHEFVDCMLKAHAPGGSPALLCCDAAMLALAGRCARYAAGALAIYNLAYILPKLPCALRQPESAFFLKIFAETWQVYRHKATKCSAFGENCLKLEPLDIAREYFGHGESLGLVEESPGANAREDAGHMEDEGLARLISKSKVRPKSQDK